METEIIYEDKDILVVNKPSGLFVHSDGADAKGTLVEWFLERSPEAQGVGEPRIGKDGKEIERSGIVHRLDRDTSGMMVLAKNQDIFDYLKKQFKDRLVKKEYRALVYGKMKDKWGTINRSIGRSPNDWRKRSADKGAKGLMREAVTEWEALSSGEYDGEVFSYLKLRPKTGRMHQLRVHLKSISRPIVGDVLYANDKIHTSNNLEMTRLALHSHKITFNLMDGREVSFTADIPESIQSAIDKIA